MAVTHSTAAKNAATDAVAALLNGGTLEILTSSDTVLAVLPLSATAFAAAVNGTATANTITADASANAAGTAAKWRAKDSGGNVVVSGTARKTADPDNGEECVLDNTSIAAGQQVSVSSWTYAALSA